MTLGEPGEGEGEGCMFTPCVPGTCPMHDCPLLIVLLVPLVVHSQAHKLRKLLVSKSVEAPPTCRAGVYSPLYLYTVLCS